MINAAFLPWLAVAVSLVALLVAIYRPYPTAKRLESLLTEYIEADKHIQRQLEVAAERDRKVKDRSP